MADRRRRIGIGNLNRRLPSHLLLVPHVILLQLYGQLTLKIVYGHRFCVRQFDRIDLIFGLLPQLVSQTPIKQMLLALDIIWSGIGEFQVVCICQRVANEVDLILFDY